MTSDNAREELARDIRRASQSWDPECDISDHIAKYLLAAGYEKYTPAGEGAGVAEDEAWKPIDADTPRDGTILILGNDEAVFTDCYAFSSTDEDEWENWLGADEPTHWQYPPRSFGYAARASRAPAADASEVEG